MALGIYFHPPSLDAKTYDEIISRLKAAGAGEPPGRLYHVCFGSGNQLQVFDVWESQEAFDKFGQTLMPLLQEMGVDPGQPFVEQVHNIIA